MNKKYKECNQYESYFMFGDEEKFHEHLKNCEYCRQENEKQKKVSLLIKEAAPKYLEREQKKRMMKSVKRMACCFIIFVAISGFTGYKWYDNFTYNNTLEQQESMVSEMGLPIDEYGFLSL